MKKFYVVSIIIALIVAASMFIQYRTFSEIVAEDIKNLSIKTGDLRASEISGKMTNHAEVIEVAAAYIAQRGWRDTELLYYFKTLMRNKPLFNSIYYGSVDNQMVNGSGWIPGKDFDLRSRPWYVKAVNEKKLIFTEAFINASKDSLVITIAKPVYNAEHKLLGVVAGDVEVEDIVQAIHDIKTEQEGYSFLIDGKGNILAHPHYDYNLTAGLRKIYEVTEGVPEQILHNPQGVIRLTLDNQEGYLAYRSIEKTDWMVGSFIPLDSILHGKYKFMGILLTTLLTATSLLLLLMWIQRRYVFAPINALEEDIQRIDLENKIAYRIPLIKNNEESFFLLRLTINSILDKSHTYLRQRDEEKQKLQASLDYSNGIMEVTPDIISVFDRQGVYLDIQTSNKELLKTNKEDLIRKTARDVLPKIYVDGRYQKIQETLATGSMQTHEYEIEVPQGRIIFETRMVPFGTDKVIAITRDITERARMIKELSDLSYRDQLTGLYNRRFLEDELRREKQSGTLPQAILMADINGLKLINDTFGFVAGDEALRKVANLLKSGCGEETVIARIGGDEFVILLPDSDEQKAKAVIKRLEGLLIEEEIGDFQISISFGYGIKQNREESTAAVMKRAEDDMHRQKLYSEPSMRRRNIDTIIKALHEKNKREEQHSQRVAVICRSLGKALGMGESDLKELGSLGLLHDIGKIGINEAILNKPGKVTEEEYYEIKRHPEIGYRILHSADDMAEIAEIVLAHHERWDGLGYPKGLKGAEIPLKARIVSLADALDAMLSDRSYRKALTENEILEEFRKNAGTQFDPGLTKILVEKVMIKEWQIITAHIN